MVCLAYLPYTPPWELAVIILFGTHKFCRSKNFNSGNIAKNELKSVQVKMYHENTLKYTKMTHDLLVKIIIFDYKRIKRVYLK